MTDQIKRWMYVVNGEAFGPTIAQDENDLKEVVFHLTGENPTNIREATPKEVGKKKQGDRWWERHSNLDSLVAARKAVQEVVNNKQEYMVGYSKAKMVVLPLRVLEDLIELAEGKPET